MADDDTKVVVVTDTLGMRKLINDARHRNRGPVAGIADRLDPNGTHICGLRFPHNDAGEWRSQWFVKETGSEKPCVFFMDNDGELFDRFTRRVLTRHGWFVTDDPTEDTFDRAEPAPDGVAAVGDVEHIATATFQRPDGTDEE